MIDDNPPYGSDNEFQRLLNCIRSGTVINRRRGTSGSEIQIAFTDRHTISDWTRVGGSGSAGSFHTYHCPDIGDNVMTLHLPTGIEQGIVICTNPTDNNPTFCPNSIDSKAIGGQDGSFFEHEPNSGTTTMAGIAHLHISADESLIYLTTEMMQVSGTSTKHVGGAITLSAGAQITVTAPMISLNGVTIDSSGNVTLPQGAILKADEFAGTTQTPVANPRITNLDGSGQGS